MFPRSWSSYIILKYKWSKHESWTLRYQPWTTLKKKKNQEKRLLGSHPIMNQKDTFRKNQHWIINKRILRGSQLFFQGACTDMAVVDKSPVQTMGGGGGIWHARRHYLLNNRRRRVDGRSFRCISFKNNTNFHSFWGPRNASTACNLALCAKNMQIIPSVLSPMPEPPSNRINRTVATPWILSCSRSLLRSSLMTLRKIDTELILLAYRQL